MIVYDVVLYAGGDFYIYLICINKIYIIIWVAKIATVQGVDERM